MNQQAGYVIGVDVGGTFTDVFYVDEVSGACGTAKVPTTRPDQADGFANGIGQAIGDLGRAVTVVHGTTVGTNALLERRGARTGVITTAGFRDVLEMRRRDRPQTWGLWGTFMPIVRRDLRLEVAERTLADGTVRTPVDPEAVKAAARQLLESGAEAVAVIFINAYANPENERRALEAVREVWPNDCVNASSAILPEIREFERASTTALNAYLQPGVGAYLGRIEKRLGEGGFKGDVLIVQSNGGVMSVDTARALPIRTALSGPAAGVIAAGAIARAAGFPNVITCDMGGTSFDVSLIADGDSVLAAQTNIDFGMTVRTPMIEITTIGAGGGSIASVDRGGLLQIGPESAGSDPGPVCYGLGNDRPTVTDANVVLGRINAGRPIGGALDRLDVAAARRAIETHVGTPLGIDVMAAAEAIIRVANARMAGAIRLVSIERGYDPRRFVAMPFGGGGSLHAGALIQEVGLAKALVPRYPGVTSALGCVIADMRHDGVQTLNAMLDDLDMEALDRQMVAAAESGRALIEGSGVTLERIDVQFELDMLYQGQTHTVAVPLEVEISEGRSNVSADRLRSAFERQYRSAYGRLLENIPIRVLNLRTAVIGRRPGFDLHVLAPAGGDLESAQTGTRDLWIDGGWQPAPVYDRLALPVGADVAGPAILEQADTTIYLDPGLRGRVDDLGNFVIERA